MINYFSTLSPYKKRYIPIYILMSVITLISMILIFTMPIISHEIITDKSNKSKSGWPIRLSAPYIDMSSWVDTANAYSISGAPNLEKLYDDSGFAYFNLGFIQPDSTKPLEDDGTIRWGWADISVSAKAVATTTNIKELLNHSPRSEKKAATMQFLLADS